MCVLCHEPIVQLVYNLALRFRSRHTSVKEVQHHLCRTFYSTCLNSAATIIMVITLNSHSTRPGSLSTVASIKARFMHIPFHRETMISLPTCR